MASHPCSMLDQRHSSPVPVIGLYIAGASLVCLVLMICDVFLSVKRKACYVPCRLFSLNSVTLALLAIISKLPVDLTTNMPSSRDQLSKLTGTTMACVCIGFMAPSLASSRESESIANMAALTIFVVTIAVNICIQMATEVIFAFIVEHIVILCCLFALLAILWYNTFDFNAEKDTLSKKNASPFFEMEEAYHRRNFMRRVRKWYITSCINNPQLLLCRAPLSSAIGPICTLCSVVLLQAAYRSLVVRSLVFCKEVSDYGWSVQIIVLSQCVAIIFGAITIAFRWLIVIWNLDMNRVFAITDELQDLKLHFFFMTRRSTRTSIRVLSRISLKLVLLVILFFIHAPILAIPFIVYKITGGRTVGEFRWWRRHKASEDDIVFSSSGLSWTDFNSNTLDGLSRQMIMFCVKTMNKWVNVTRDSSSSHMVQMLSRRPDLSTSREPDDLSTSSQPNLSTSTHLNGLLRVGNKYSPMLYKVTCLTMALLVKLGVATIPSTLTQSIRDTLCEAFKIVYYIDTKMNVEGIESRKRRLAKFIWEGGDIDMSKEIPSEYLNDPVKYAVSNIESAFCVLPHKELLLGDLKAIRDFIRLRQYGTIEEFCECMEQLFLEMLHFFLTQLPNCVSKVAEEVPVEDCEAQARSTTKLLCEVLDSRLEDKVGWIIPRNCVYDDHFFPRIEVDT